MILLHLTETKCLAASKYIYEKCHSTLAWAVYREREELGPKDENDELRSWRFLFVFDEEGWKDVQSSHVTEKTRYLGFLAEAFQPRAFWFIIFENVRRLLLSSALIIFAAGSDDAGTTPQAIDTCLTVADETDTQVAIHTDTLNESGFVEETLRAIAGRTIHTYHTEGAGGGHAPDIIKAAGLPNILPSSTNPTRPYTINTVDEHLDMLMVCHHLSPNIPEDVAFADSRIRKETIAAEDILHDKGAFSMIASDSQAMGRVGEVITRTWQTAHKMKDQFGSLVSDPDWHDNFRARRYIAKYTINPAIAHGIAHEVGSVEIGKMADLVLWKPAFFGTKPALILKSGFIVAAPMGDPNASIPTPQPVHYRTMFGAMGSCPDRLSATFVSDLSLQRGNEWMVDTTRQLLPVKNIRSVKKSDMVLNDYQPTIEVDPETYEVRADGELLVCEPARSLPLAQRYYLF